MFSFDEDVVSNANVPTNATNASNASNEGKKRNEKNSGNKNKIQQEKNFVKQNDDNNDNNDNDGNNDMQPVEGGGWTESSVVRKSPPTLPTLTTRFESIESTSAPTTPVNASSSHPFTPVSFETKKEKENKKKEKNINQNKNTTGLLSINTENNDDNELETRYSPSDDKSSMHDDDVDQQSTSTIVNGADDDILRESVYEEMMDLVLIMLRIGVGADRTHAFVHWVFAAHGMTREMEEGEEKKKERNIEEVKNKQKKTQDISRGICSDGVDKVDSGIEAKDGK